MGADQRPIDAPPPPVQRLPGVEVPSRRGRLSTNLAANVFGFAISVGIGIWYTPYLIHQLGTAAYGIIPLVTQLTGYMTILSSALNAAVARYVTISLEEGDHQTANEYFNTSFFGSLGLAAALLAPAVWATINIDVLINVPDGHVASTRWLFASAVAAFMLNTIQTPFGVSTYCMNRFELRKAVELIRQLVGVTVVLVLFGVRAPGLWAVGLGILLGTVFAFVASVRFWRVLTPTLRVARERVSWRAVRGLTSMGVWVSVNAIGSLLFLAIDLLVANRLFGPEPSGRYAAALMWSNLLRSIAGVVSDVFAPTVLYHYARHDIEGLITYARRAMKSVGLAIALPVGLVCGFSAPLLRAWLGPGFVDLSGLMTLLTIHLSVNLAVLPLFAIQTATKRVRLPGLVTLATGAANLGLALLLAGPMGWGLYGIAAAGAIVLTAKNLLFTPIYAARIVGRTPLGFFREAVPIVAASLVTVAACKAMSASWDLGSWPRLIIAGSGVSLAYAGLAYLLLLDSEEKKMLRGLVPFGRA